MLPRLMKRMALPALAFALATGLITAGSAQAAPRHAPQETLRWDSSSLREIYVPPSGDYSYAPSVLDIGATRWVWTCHNAQSRVIRDHIFLEKFVHGRLVEDRSVLQATDGAWDSFHTCDPSVVSGRFRFNGSRYGWAMFYLGNDLDASAHNQIGVAFATTPDGPWVKYPNPVVSFSNPHQWGAGQPSAIASDPHSGRITLFYTQGDTSTRAYWRSLNFSDMDAPAISAPHLVTIAGLTGTDGAPDYLNNYDIAYDASRHSFVIVREQHPYPTTNPSWIGQSVDVDTISAAGLLNGTGRWRSLNSITPGLTGLARNHNAGLVRTRNGFLPKTHHVTVVFTSSCAGATCDSLFNYDLWQITGRIRDSAHRSNGSDPEGASAELFAPSTRSITPS